VYVYIKFSTSVPHGTIQTFERILREFVKGRPREWASFVGFRATRVVADVGFIGTIWIFDVVMEPLRSLSTHSLIPSLSVIEYAVNLIHRESWQSALSIFESKAEVTSFCLELSKKLDIRYESPSMPVDLSIVTGLTSQQNQFLKTVLGGTCHQSTTGNGTTDNIKTPNDSDIDNNNDNNPTMENEVPSTGSAATTSVEILQQQESDIYNELMIMYNGNTAATNTTTSTTSTPPLPLTTAVTSSTTAVVNLVTVVPELPSPST
jgi:hypothetical protein